MKIFAIFSVCFHVDKKHKNRVNKKAGIIGFLPTFYLIKPKFYLVGYFKQQFFVQHKSSLHCGFRLQIVSGIQKFPFEQQFRSKFLPHVRSVLD